MFATGGADVALVVATVGASVREAMLWASMTDAETTVGVVDVSIMMLLSVGLLIAMVVETTRTVSLMVVAMSPSNASAEALLKVELVLISRENLETVEGEMLL